MSNTYGNATVEIVEQTHSNPIRFRYRIEGHSAGSILGVNSTDEKKTYPAIRVNNYDGRVLVVVSCVTVDKRPKPHPNCLIGKECSKGVRTVEFETFAVNPKVFSFQNLGVECSKATDVFESLEQRRDVARIDPFRTGFEHMHNPKSIDLHRIRLCFQVFIQKDPASPPRTPLPPVLSNVLTNKTQTNVKLFIHNVSEYSSPACGGRKILIFCDRVDKKDIAIQFYEEDEQRSVVWVEQVTPINVHRRAGISFITPAYKIKEINGPVNVFFRLQTLSGKRFSNPIAFQYVPNANSKKRKMDDSRALHDYMQTSSQPVHPLQMYNIRPQKQHRMDPNHGNNEPMPCDPYGRQQSQPMGNYQPIQPTNHAWQQIGPVITEQFCSNLYNQPIQPNVTAMTNVPEYYPNDELNLL